MQLVLVQPRLDRSEGADNAQRLREALTPWVGTLGAEDIVVLPEHYHLGSDRDAYLAEVQGFARWLGAAVVGGSQHQRRAGRLVHAGVAVEASGEVAGWYEKLRPYALERGFVTPGERLGELRLAGRPVLVLLCADFWFSDLVLRAQALPELIVVPALSVSRKPTPDYSRALWRHLSVARAYELGAYVGVSDWAHESSLPVVSASGVAGLADPTREQESQLFQPVRGAAQRYELDFPALERFRGDRRERGFFWR